MVAQNIFFGILAAVVAISALRMVTTRNIVHAALYLVAVLAGLGALYVLLTAEFVATTQVLVYIGAVMGFLYLYRYRLLLFESVAVALANFTTATISRPLWHSLAEHQQNRILVYLNPEGDPSGAGYHVIQSKVAVGSGGFSGLGVH